jgi:hypothetical protein
LDAPAIDTGASNQDPPELALTFPRAEVILNPGDDHRHTPSQPTPTGLSFGEKGTISSVRHGSRFSWLRVLRWGLLRARPDEDP